MANMKKYNFYIPQTKKGLIEVLMKLYPKESRQRLNYTKADQLKARLISSGLAGRRIPKEPVKSKLKKELTFF